MTELTHAHVEEYVAAFALDALEPAERTTVEKHVRSCASCAELVRRAERVAGLLGLAVEAEAPPAGHFGRFQTRLRAEPRTPFRLVANRARFVLAAAAVLVMTFGGWSWQLRQELARQDQLVRVVATGEPRELSTNAPGGDVHGRAYVDPATNQVALTVSRLPLLAANRTYAIWFTRGDGGLVRGGTFGVGKDGSAAVLAAAPGGLQSYVGVGVTDEPLGGSATPSTPMMLYWYI
jgi:anti-sigma-K factor RskA